MVYVQENDLPEQKEMHILASEKVIITYQNYSWNFQTPSLFKSSSILILLRPFLDLITGTLFGISLINSGELRCNSSVRGFTVEF